MWKGQPNVNEPWTVFWLNCKRMHVVCKGQKAWLIDPSFYSLRLIIIVSTGFFVLERVTQFPWMAFTFHYFLPCFYSSPTLSSYSLHTRFVSSFSPQLPSPPPSYFKISNNLALVYRQSCKTARARLNPRKILALQWKCRYFGMFVLK